ncbi:vacuolar protein sorting/targeting protein PEP1, partial [Nowakowskiella sp. JEL0078]
FSIDEGNTFTDIKITQYTGGEKLRVTNIISEPTGSTAYFIVFGTIRDNSGSSRGTKTIAITLDFSLSFSRKCDFNKDDPASSDYEAFSPGLVNDNSGVDDSSTPGCLFGRKVTYYIRKQDRECRIHQEFMAPIESVEPCKCTRADYECDYNYFYDAKSNKCVMYTGLQKPKPYCHSDGTSRESTGYVKSKFSQCVGGDILDNGTIVGSCKGCLSGIGWFGVFAATFGFVGFITWGFSSYKKHGRIRLPTDDLDLNGNANTFSEKVTLVFHAVALFALEAAEWVADRTKRAYDTVVRKLHERGRSRGFAPFNDRPRTGDGYVAVFADETDQMIGEEEEDMLAFNPTDPNDASLLSLVNEDDY